MPRSLPCLDANGAAPSRATYVLAVLALLASACPWRSYAEVMTVHLDVLAAMADKAEGNAQAGKRPTSNDVVELTYPLQRARQFAYQYRNDSERASYRAFIAALDSYEALIQTIDAARGDQARWTAEQPRVSAAYASWRAAALQVREEIRKERQS